EDIADKEYVRYFYECKDKGDVTRARGYRHGFLLGFIHRIAQRFDEEKRKMNNDTTGTALVNREALDVENFLKGRQRVNALSRRSAINGTGYSDGQKRANSMNIGANAVHGSKKSSGQI